MTDTDGGVATVEQTETETRTMPMYKVIMHNDDVTTMEFVVAVLTGIFRKEAEQAIKITMEIHKSGPVLPVCMRWSTQS